MKLSGTGRAMVMCLAVMLLGALGPEVARAHGAFHQRLTKANAAIEAAPESAEPYLVRAELFHHHGDFTEALADVDRAIAREPGLARAEYVRAETLRAAGRHGEAVASYGRFLGVHPEQPAAQEGRGLALLALGRPLEAARDLDIAIERQPVALPETYLARARALAAAGDAHVDEAIAGLDAGVAKLGPVVTLQRAALDLEVRRGNVDAALVRLDGMRSRSPRQEAWLAQRGEILEAAGRRDDARAAYHEALAALAELPLHRRETGAMRQLEAKLRGAIQRLSPSEGSADRS